MVARVLVTTAVEETWPSDQPILFLGGWCQRYPRRGHWQSLDATVARPYGLSQAQRDIDYQYVHKVHKLLLKDVSRNLNQFHGVDHSERYWQIVLGHWLIRYTCLIFNRWATLKQCLEENDLTGISLVKDDAYDLVTLDTVGTTWAANDDYWNAVLDSRIVTRYLGDRIPLIFVHPAKPQSSFVHAKPDVVPITLSSKQKAASALRRALRSIRRDREVFLLNTYLSSSIEVKLEFLLGQSPKTWSILDVGIFSSDNVDRRLLQFQIETDDEFVSCAGSFLYELLPKCLVESYQSVVTQSEHVPWPRNPKVIFTSNNFDYDELFKVWAAAKVEAGSRYCTGQHGNNIGTRKNYPTESECVDTSDKFVTWGWVDGDPKHAPAFIFKTVGRTKPATDQRGGLLLVDLSIESRFWPWDTDIDTKVHQDEQFQFIDHLPEDIKDQVSLRLWPSHKLLPWADEERWLDRFPTISYEDGQVSMNELVARNRLVVHSYDSTGILEGLYWNNPLIAFWAGGLEHLRESARPYYQLLVNSGIVHLSPLSAADHISNVWENVEQWWMSGIVQSARKEFCDRYARDSKSPAKDIKYLIQS